MTVALWAPWALATAAVEYFLVLPWLQPLVRMQVPYWTASMVHLTSGAAYPLLPWIREGLTGRAEDGAEGARRAALGLAGGTAALGAVALLGKRGIEPRWPWIGDADERFIRLMHSHHEIGVELSELCAERSQAGRLRTLGRLMYVEHVSELGVMRSWWRSWFGGEVPEPSHQEHEQMPGMPPREALDELRRLRGREFERRFVRVMIDHHLGAVEMANDAWRDAGDPRVRLFADAIRHAQTGQIERMARYA